MPLHIKNVHRALLSASKHRPRNASFQLVASPFLVKARRISEMTTVYTDKAMTPVNPYAQAIKTSHAIYCSGQIHTDASGTLIGGTVTEKTAQALASLTAVLEEAGSSLSKVVKVQVFLVDMKDFAEMNAEYGKWMAHKPARTCVAVRELPMGASVEIECVALP